MLTNHICEEPDRKKRLQTSKKKDALNPEPLKIAEQKADTNKDIRFFFGRHQRPKKEDYCGLRWCDIDTEKSIIRLLR